MITNIDGKTLKKMFLAGAKNLEAKKEWINELNVFPVPDGDTGTNMTLTIMSAAKEVNNIEEPDMVNLSKAISSGSLRGARGNSGVILSQLLRGFCKGIRDTETLEPPALSTAFQKAVETAYKAVMKPKEGTILTVAKGMSEKAREVVLETDDLEYMIDEIIKHGDYVLSQTPEMLPVLKQAGVVDSGGQGLMQVIKGAYDAFLGKEIDFSFGDTQTASAGAANVKSDEIDTANIKYGYCTEFIIMLEKEYNDEKEQELKAYLESIGDSLVVVSDDDIVKIHVHTNDPGLAIQKALTFGSLTKMKIDNMREEHQEKLIKDAEKVAAKQKAEDEAKKAEEQKKNEPRKAVGFIAVSIGEGMNEIFKGLGVDQVIEGGQTMNPSTEDVLNAIDKVNADTIFVLPNNKNIILAAEQAATLTKDKNIVVIPSKNVPQGINAIINFIQDLSADDNKAHMIEEMGRVKTGSVTYAVRDTVIDDKTIKENDIMGIGDAGIISVGTDIHKTTVDMISNLIDDESEIISIYFGSDVSEEDANQIADKISELYADVEVDVNYGGQPIYYYVVSVE